MVYSTIILVLKTQICFNVLVTLENTMNIIQITFVHVPLNTSFMKKTVPSHSPGCSSMCKTPATSVHTHPHLVLMFYQIPDNLLPLHNHYKWQLFPCLLRSFSMESTINIAILVFLNHYNM
jgi:hypothetical protein